MVDAGAEWYHPGMVAHRRLLTASLIIALCAAGGCVRRTMTVDSDPPGAIVWLNDREVGRTPLDVDFLFYGEYDVRLVREGHEPKLTSGMVRPPLWDNIPIDFFVELVPFKLHSRTSLFYQLETRDDDPDKLLGRARELRTRTSEFDSAREQ